ncbi:MAG TPA: hypothetical protein VJL83_01140 [Patescibacteria group bacterium]|nr:hypothetical protein [Patescibacteria group bacterium]
MNSLIGSSVYQRMSLLNDIDRFDRLPRTTKFTIGFILSGLFTIGLLLGTYMK